jgi:hypothetical protein
MRAIACVVVALFVLPHVASAQDQGKTPRSEENTANGLVWSGTFKTTSWGAVTKDWQTYTFAEPQMKVEPVMRIVFDDKADGNTLICWKGDCRRLEEIWPDFNITIATAPPMLQRIGNLYGITGKPQEK